VQYLESQQVDRRNNKILMQRGLAEHRPPEGYCS